MTSRPLGICMIGYGEAGGILAADLAAQNLRVRAFDILIKSEAGRSVLEPKAAAARVELCESLEQAVANADLIISAVTAASAQHVARECERILRPGQYFLDINSLAPHTKRSSAECIERSGATYIEAAVMAPVPPQRLKVPILLGGKHAAELCGVLKDCGMNVEVVSAEIGIASAIKMCRSIMIKGLEALTVECLFAARRYGADAAVIASLHASFPSLGWNGAFPDYLISRVAEHGRRRAAEMREVAVTLQDVGINPCMATATAVRQEALVDAMHSHDCRYDAGAKFSWRELADHLTD